MVPSGDHAGHRIIVIICQPGLVTAIGIHDIDFIVAIAVGGKGNPGAVRRPRRIQISGSIICEAGLVTTIGIHDVDFLVAITIGVKGNLGAIR